MPNTDTQTTTSISIPYHRKWLEAFDVYGGICVNFGLNQ